MASFEEEAFNRARQMHQNRRVGNFSNPQVSPVAPPSEPKTETPDITQPAKSDNININENQTQTAEHKNIGISEIFFENKEQSLILLLLILLMEENTEPTLLLALVYLLM